MQKRKFIYVLILAAIPAVGLAIYSASQKEPPQTSLEEAPVTINAPSSIPANFTKPIPVQEPTSEPPKEVVAISRSESPKVHSTQNLSPPKKVNLSGIQAMQARLQRAANDQSNAGSTSANSPFNRKATEIEKEDKVHVGVVFSLTETGDIEMEKRGIGSVLGKDDEPKTIKTRRPEVSEIWKNSP